MTSRVASLGMYDAPSIRGANDWLWTAIAARLRADGIDGVPDSLDRSRPLDEIWDDPCLLLAQTCGYPLATRWRGRLRYVATPRYDVPGCVETEHRSRVIVRAADPAATLADLRGRRLALNDRASNTGMNLLRALVAPLAIDGVFFGAVIETGSHAASADLVASGGADIAAVDAVSYAHHARDRPAEAAGLLRTLAFTDAAPCLPFVTAASASDRLVAALRAAITGAIEDAGDAAASLFLAGTEAIGLNAYDRLLTLERDAAALDYSRLA